MWIDSVSVGWTAENLEESPPSLLRWTSKAGTENYGAASFTPVADGCDVEVKITYKTPRAIYAIVEGRRAQSIIRSLLRATLVRFGKKMEGMFPEDDALVADRIMIGQYPHCQPAVPGPTGSDAKDHLRRLLDTGIDCFACLQAEVPPQDTTAGWVQFPVKDGFKEGVLLQDDDARSRFPAPFVRYYEDVYNIAMEVSGGQWLGPSYLHCPIEDLSLPGGGWC